MNTPNTAMDASLQAAVRKAQADEEAGAVLYGFMNSGFGIEVMYSFFSYLPTMSS